MRLRSLNADGSQSSEQEFDLSIKDADGALYDPPVTIRCRLVPSAQRKTFERQSVEFVKNPVTRGMQKETNYEAVADLMMQAAVISWEGIDGADGKPLICSEQTKPHLPSHVKVQVLESVSSTEAAAGSPASFPESANVVRVVGGRRAK